MGATETDAMLLVNRERVVSWFHVDERTQGIAPQPDVRPKTQSLGVDRDAVRQPTEPRNALLSVVAFPVVHVPVKLFSC
jgi:hypothetical protein